MARKVNLNDGDFKRFKRIQGALATQTPLSSTAVERGSTRWLDGSTVFIEGLLDVTGTLNGSGTNNFGGTNNLSGVNKLTGPTTVAGNFEMIAGGQFKSGSVIIRPDGSADFGALKIDPTGKLTSGQFQLNPDGSAKFGLFDIAANGNLASKGSLSIEGPTVLKNNLTVDPGKKITLGGLVLENQSSGTAAVQMPGGGISASNTLGMSLDHDKIQVNGQTSATIASVLINLNAPQTSVNGNLVATGIARFTALTTGAAGTPANVHVDSQGRLWRANP